MACSHPKPPGWTRCRDCAAEWMRDYRKIFRAMEVRSAKREGAEEMRTAIIQHFTRFDRVGFAGGAVAQIVRNLEVD